MTNPGQTGQGTPPGPPQGSQSAGFNIPNPFQGVASLGSGLNAIGSFFSNLGILGGWLANPLRIIKMITGFILLGAALIVTFLPEAAGAVTGVATGNVEAGVAVKNVLRGKPREAGEAAVRGAARSVKAQAREAEAVSRERTRVRAAESRRAQEQEARRVAQARRQRDVFHAGAGERQPKARKPARSAQVSRAYAEINQPSPPRRPRGQSGSAAINRAVNAIRRAPKARPPEREEAHRIALEKVRKAKEDLDRG